MGVGARRTVWERVQRVGASTRSRPCPQLCPQLLRWAASAPVVLLGEPDDVRRVAGRVEEAAPGREVLDVDVWLRRRPGVTHVLTKLQLRILHGPGDIDRNKVCILPELFAPGGGCHT